MTAGQGVVWYSGQFYALFFLTGTLKVDTFTANLLVAWSLAFGSGGFILFGWLSDKIGRKPIILGGGIIAALTYFPVFNLWYPIVIAAGTFVIGAIFVPETRDRDIFVGDTSRRRDGRARSDGAGLIGPRLGMPASGDSLPRRFFVGLTPARAATRMG